jgi:hypothetical protein
MHAMARTETSLFIMALFATTRALDSLRRNSKVILKLAYDWMNLAQSTILCQAFARRFGI